LDRVWRIVLSPEDDKGQPQKFSARELRRVAHQTIQRYERDADAFSFNTVVSAMMEFTNTLFKARDAGLVGTPEWAEAIDILVRLLAPIAPHMAEELWERMGCDYSIHQQRWPRFDAAAAKEDEITIPVQINGKVRDRVTVAAETDDEAIKSAALSADNVRKFLDGKTPKQVIYVKGRMVSVVV
jgi:leucyl-tRNA synthetase